MDTKVLWFESALLPSGWAAQVRVTAINGRIDHIVKGVPAESGDERHGIALPGMPNLHSHAFQRGLAGLTERRGAHGDSFWTWRELMYQFVERITPDDFEAVTALAYAEMLEGGFTHVGEFHYLHHDLLGKPFSDPGELAGRVVAAATQTGIGLTLLPVFYAHSGFGGAAPTARQRRFISDPTTYERILEASRRAVRGLPGAHVGVAPHSLRAVTPAEFSAILALASDSPVHIHIAEQVKEIEDCQAWSGQRPIEWLFEHADLNGRWCLIHATHATDAELTSIIEHDVIAGLCPMTEASLGDGIFPAASFVEREGRFGIGSDSNIRLDAAEELRQLEYSQRLVHLSRNVLAEAGGTSTGRSLFDSALTGGWQALQGSDASGAGLCVGALLDAVSLRPEDPALIARHQDDILDRWIFSVGRDAIDCVWRAGMKVVSSGRHRDRDLIVARYARALRNLTM